MDSVHKLGRNDEFGKFVIDSVNFISAGRNTGLAYHAAIPFQLTFQVSVNTNAMKLGSVFYNMQPFFTTRFEGLRQHF